MYESEFEKNLYQQRRDKLQQIAALGQANGLTYAEATYPNHYAATHTIPELRAAYDALTAEQLESAAHPIEVSIAGSDEWFPFFPADGIFDEQREELDIDLKNIVKTLPALVSVRVYDKANNFVVRSVLVK